MFVSSKGIRILFFSFGFAQQRTKRINIKVIRLSRSILQSKSNVGLCNKIYTHKTELGEILTSIEWGLKPCVLVGI